MTAADLKALLELQQADTLADQLKHRWENLPELAALGAIDRQILDAQSEMGSAAGARDDVEARQRELEAELSATDGRAETVSRRLYSGEVSASRELQAMSADVDALKERSSHLEDAILEVLEELEPLEKRVSELESGLAMLRRERDLAAEALGTAQSIVETEMAAVASQRAELVGRVPEQLLAVYEQLRSRLGGIAVARLVASRCDGCHLTLPATELDRIRHLPPGELVTCDQCGRILVP